VELGGFSRRKIIYLVLIEVELMLVLKGDFKKGMKISNWLKEKGLEHSRDYTWYRRSKNDIDPEDCVVFLFKNPKWETMVLLKWQ
jgi:hypothetical protein